MKIKSKRGVREEENELLDRQILQIQNDRLDWECGRQADLYFEFGEKLANARMDLEQAKSELELTEAEVDQDIRTNYKKKYTTEAAIKMRIKRDRRYTKMIKRVLRLKHDVDIFQTVVSGLDHKKRMLEKMVDLFGMNYFSTPRVKSSASRDVIADVKARRHRDQLNDDD